MNFTLPMASSSDAVGPRQLLDTSGVRRGLTWVEGRLEGGESVVLEHVQESLLGIQLAVCMFGKPNGLTVFPALSRPRKRIFAFLCRRPVDALFRHWDLWG